MEDAIEVDTHFHIWDLNRMNYAWPRPDEEKSIYRNFSAEDYNKERQKTLIKHSIFVEAHNSAEETEWVLEIADKHEFIKGVVGYVTLESPDKLQEELKRFTKYPKFVGVRRIPGFEEKGWFARKDVDAGLKKIAEYNLIFELLIKKEDFVDAEICVKNNPKLKFVIDHLAKPNAATGEDSEWFDGMAKFATYSNVHCKLSGMVTEGDLQNWKPSDFAGYVSHIVKHFGVDRIMFGSDWPVCKMANAHLIDVHNLLKTLLKDLRPQDQAKVFGQNAIKFYNLKL